MKIYGIDPHLWQRFLAYLADKTCITTSELQIDLAVSLPTARKLMHTASTIGWGIAKRPAMTAGGRMYCIVRTGSTTPGQTTSQSRLAQVFAYLADKTDVSSNDLIRDLGISRGNVPWYFDRIMREYPGQWRKVPLQQAGRGRPYMMLARIKPGQD